MVQINIPDAIQLEPMKKLSFYFSAPVSGMLHLVILVPAGQYNHAYSTCYFDANFQNRHFPLFIHRQYFTLHLLLY